MNCKTKAESTEFKESQKQKNKDEFTLQQQQWAADCRAAHRMRKEGGHFASAIADAYFAADSRNKDRVLSTFRDLFDRFATPEEN